MKRPLMLGALLFAALGTGCPPTAADETVEDQTPAAPPIAAPAPAPEKPKPPPEKPKDKGPESDKWWRDVEKDPVAALKDLDPSALSRKGPPRPGKVQLATSDDEGETKRDSQSTKAKSQRIRPWPPQLDKPYPTIELRDHTGALISTDEFLGKVVLVEVTTLGSAASHALAGGNEQGKARFRGVEPRRGLDKVEAYVKRFAQIDPDSRDVVFVRLVTGGMESDSLPTEEEVHAFAQHFGVGNRTNNVVLVGDKRVSHPFLDTLGPTFHLIDRKGILRARSASFGYTTGLNRRIVPMLKELVEGTR